MAETFTANLLLSKFSQGMNPGAHKLNANWDKIDTTIGFLANIKHYGAVGDGVTDNKDAIALANAAVLAAGGGEVLIPIGTFYTSERVAVPNAPIKYSGLGKGSILKIGTATISAFYMNHDNIWTWDDFQILGGGVAGQTAFEFGASSSSSAPYFNLIRNVFVNNVEKGVKCDPTAFPQVKTISCYWQLANLSTCRHWSGPGFWGATDSYFWNVSAGLAGTRYGGIDNNGGSDPVLEWTNSTITYKNGNVQVSQANMSRCNLFEGVFKVLDGANSAFTGVNFFQDNLPHVARPLDLDGCDLTHVIGCVFERYTGEAIRLTDSSRCVIMGNRYCRVTEVGTSDFNQYIGNEGFGDSTIIGPGSTVDSTNVRNVRSFGAVGDGVEDDSGVFQFILDTAPASGVEVELPPGDYFLETGLDLPDKNVTFRWSPGARIIIGSEVITVFSIATVTARRLYRFINPSVHGDATSGQVFLEKADDSVLALADVQIENPDVTGFEIPFFISDGDTTYGAPTQIHVVGGRIMPTALAGSKLIKTTAAPGSFAFPVAISFTQTQLNNPANGDAWNLSFDGDLFLTDIDNLPVKGSCGCNGLQCSGSVSMYGASVQIAWELFGQAFYSTDTINALILSSVELKLSWRFNINSIRLISGTLVVNSIRCKIGNVVDQGGAQAAKIDILAGADFCSVTGGYLAVGTTAQIRTAADSGTFTGICFNATAKTFLELAGADKNIVAGCTGVSTGTGFTLVGAGSICDVTIANVA